MAYVVAAIVALGLLVGAHEVGYGRAAKAGRAELASYKAQAEAEAQKLRTINAEVREKVVVQYRDKIKRIPVPGPEVVRNVEIIRNSGCVLPGEFRVLHDAAATGGADAAPGVDGSAETVDCATAIETVTANYRAAREEVAKLEALQAWARGVSTPQTAR